MLRIETLRQVWGGEEGLDSVLTHCLGGLKDENILPNMPLWGVSRDAGLFWK